MSRFKLAHKGSHKLAVKISYLGVYPNDIRVAFGKAVTPSESFIISYILFRTDSDGEGGMMHFTQSIQTLAYKTGYSVATVRRAIRRLEDKGIFETEFTQDGRYVFKAGPWMREMIRRNMELRNEGGEYGENYWQREDSE